MIFQELKDNFPNTVILFMQFLAEKREKTNRNFVSGIEIDITGLFLLMEFLEQHKIYVWVKPYEPEGLFRPYIDYRYSCTELGSVLHTRTDALSIGILAGFKYLEKGS